MNTEELDKRINKTLSGWEIPSKQEKQAIWQSIFSAIGTKQKRIITLKKWYWIAAASLVAVFVSYTIFYNSNVEYATGINEKMTISLPDGSSVDMNAESKASYNTLSWYLTRSVSLSGEAFFKVKNGSQFSVKTSNGVVKVLGTSFNVFSRESSFLVECFTGKVEIRNKINQVIITKGEKVIQSNSLALTKELFDPTLPNWVGNDNHYYNKTNLETVFNDIEKAFEVVIISDKAITSMKFSGEWNNTMNLDDVLKIVCMPFNLEATTVSEKEVKIQKIEE